MATRNWTGVVYDATKIGTSVVDKLFLVGKYLYATVNQAGVLFLDKL